MRAFEKYTYSNFFPAYVEDFEAIIAYLTSHGNLNVSGEKLYRLYSDFSEDCYCAGWMGVVNDGEEDERLLEEFANWLEDYEI